MADDNDDPNDVLEDKTKNITYVFCHITFLKIFAFYICLTFIALSCLISSCRVDKPHKKAKKFRWKSTHDISLLIEVISTEPYRWRHGSRERGDAFRRVAESLKLIPNSGFPISLSQRGVRTRFFELLDAFKKQESIEARATGIDAEYDEKSQLLTDIHSRMKDFEHGFDQEMEKNSPVA